MAKDELLNMPHANTTASRHVAALLVELDLDANKAERHQSRLFDMGDEGDVLWTLKLAAQMVGVAARLEAVARALRDQRDQVVQWIRDCGTEVVPDA